TGRCGPVRDQRGVRVDVRGDRQTARPGSGPGQSQRQRLLARPPGGGDRCAHAGDPGTRIAQARGRCRCGPGACGRRKGPGDGDRGARSVICAVMTSHELVTAARSGSIRAAGRLLSLVEGPRRDEVLAALAETAPPRVIGITGPPGAGKSTTVGALVGAYRERGRRVAVLAVDPSSPYSGGALLGDRIRMAAHINDPEVLIRSVARHGDLGDLAAAVPAAIRLLPALDFDLVVLESVGVGQSEIEIAAIADPTVVIVTRGAGDAVQAAKAGLLEVADLVVVNKAD